MKTHVGFIKLGLLATFVLTLSVGGCPWTQTPNTSDLNAKLVPFKSADEMREYFRDQARHQYTQNRSLDFFSFLPGGALAPTANDALEDDAEGGATTDYSTTNVQEEGVDEADVIKSDGAYLYVARGDSLRIVRAAPAETLEEIGRLDFDDLLVSDMYLYGDKIILLAQRYTTSAGGWEEPAYDLMIWPPYYTEASLTLVEVDITDKEDPQEIKQVELDGTLVDSRLTNDRLILVMTIAPQLPNNPNALTIGAMSLEEFLPKQRIAEEENDVVAWSDCLHPEDPDGYYMTAVLTLDAADVETIVHSTAIVGGAGTIYASTEALYVTNPQYDWNEDLRETTDIHKFAFDEDGAAVYAASGSVPGQLLNQFSLGENDGYLRVATHIWTADFWGVFADDVAVEVSTADAPAQTATPPSNYNAVYVLGETDGALEVTGYIENIAPGEQLYSARFIGDRGFLVTFYQVDPLFTLDLSDPTKPEIKGELEIPGYSDYLHPWGDNYLIGVGRSTTDAGWGTTVDAVQLTLFDISDLTAPVEIDQIELGGYGSWSDVSSTHKAFAAVSANYLIALPVHLTDEDTEPWIWDAPVFDGVICFNVDPVDGFTEVGRLDTVVNNAVSYLYYGGWRRPALIDNMLYSLSDDGVARADLGDLANAEEIEFAE